jgi:carbonic anhydrase/acetyltransferase-like protein (isoleucine patch superfamily)
VSEQVQVHPTAFIAPTATLMGAVSVGAGASVWFGCVLRAEAAPIVIGPRTNVQDLTVIHTDPGYPCRLGSGVTIGHRAVIHGATVEDGAFIGIGSIILNGAVVGEEAIVGAGAVVTEGTVVPPRTLALGVPARVARPLRPQDLNRARVAADWYVEHARRYREESTHE